MGESFSVLSCGALNAEERLALEKEYGLKIPLGPGRYPSLNEVRQALDELGLATSYEQGSGWWSALVDDAGRDWASIHVSDYSGDPDQPHSLYFERGRRPLAEQILKRLSLSCGAFILAPHSGDKPSLIATP